MAFIRKYLLTAAVGLLAYVNLQAQTVYYPAGQSQLLRSTAEDMAMQLQKAVAGSHFTAEQYSTTMPSGGIVLIYDQSITANQTCKVKSNGTNLISFTAGQDNGLCYGVYEYLYQLGFRFYQPGSVWEVIPVLNSPYKHIDTTYTCHFKYKNWFISGGCNTWAMDRNSNYYWDTYYGELGHEYALYQRRNNMVGAYRFAGHRDDVLTPAYKTELQNNPCYVAPYNGSRAATGQSVPDINNVAAMQLWANGIENKYSSFRNTIFGNTALYANYVKNFEYNYGNIGIEVPDGAKWANSETNDCGNKAFPRESDQHFLLANFTAAAISNSLPGKTFQLYAYDSHADVPSSKITIHQNIDVQVVPTAFHFETSAKGLMNRWYGRSNQISEYHYLNLAQWSGETPSFYLKDLEQTIQRLKEKNSQGIIWEASASKFASLPFLLAANTALKNDESIDSKLKEFCSLFGEASGTIYKLLLSWSDDKTVTVYNGLQDNKYKLPYYLQLVKQADTETLHADPIIRTRVNELKAFLHYMVLYYDWTFDQRSAANKAEKGEALCLYLAKICRLQLVNSSVLINNVVRQYNETDNIYERFNITNGTVYSNGRLPLITAEEITSSFNADLASQTQLISNYSFKDAAAIQTQFDISNMLPLDKINVQLGFTNGKDYTARSEFYLLAEKAGSFTVKFNPKFDMPGKGLINITVEDVNKAIGILKDYTIDKNSGAGIIHIDLPQAGTYKLSISSKYKSSAAITITTNGNYFYKNGPFFGSSVENYRGDLLSLPGWFYVPSGIDKVFFSVNNSNPGGAGFVTAEEISRTFVFKDEQENTVEPKIINTSDSGLFYLQLPSSHTGVFWHVVKMEQARLCFANISNIEWYAQRKPCTQNDFIATIKEGGTACITQLKAMNNAASLSWEVYDAQKWYQFDNKQVVELPAVISPNAIVSLKTGMSCVVTKRVGDDKQYLQQKNACGLSATPASSDIRVVIYPNPGTGVFRCLQNGEPVLAQEAVIFNASGVRMTQFTNTQQFNISSLPAGIYFYTLKIDKVTYKGKLVKM
ncbi:MAG TPA: T9SS type A sorting domain-containing protein [Ferruginibacter sp.]|nr:T9SS type A sorting domain-containing protein [Ferruginibacter sp.]